MNIDVMYLETLDAGERGIYSLERIEHLVNLWELDIGHNNISELGPLAGLINLQKLLLYCNDFRDISRLVDNPGLGSGDIINLTY